MLERAARGEFASWAASPRRRLALIILFDQVPRNAYRGTAAAFAFDREALALAVEGLQLAADAALDPIERLFFYLPLEHAESLEAQDAADRGVRAAGGRSAAGPARLLRVHARATRASIAISSRSSGAFRIAMRCWGARARRRRASVAGGAPELLRLKGTDRSGDQARDSA